MNGKSIANGSGPAGASFANGNGQSIGNGLFWGRDWQAGQVQPAHWWFTV